MNLANIRNMAKRVFAGGGGAGNDETAVLGPAHIFEGAAEFKTRWRKEAMVSTSAMAFLFGVAVTSCIALAISLFVDGSGVVKSYFTLFFGLVSLFFVRGALVGLHEIYTGMRADRQEIADLQMVAQRLRNKILFLEGEKLAGPAEEAIESASADASSATYSHNNDA